ncbi:MAG: GGDEF domain-containing protein [Clostridium sp.]|uniref:GGDEF domain-containing protein n=1 Tax=Clostridium sp. TaxID=1506 RepID=UPI002FC6871C
MDYNDLSKEELIKILGDRDRDIVALHSKNHKLSRELCVDTLTGIPNNRFGINRLQDVYTNVNRNKESLIFCFIDIDDFKVINDTYGHREGDNAIVTVAKTISESIRKSDCVFRYAGDEFGVVFRNSSEEDIHIVLKCVQERLNRKSNQEGNYKIGISYGWCKYIGSLDSEISIEDIINEADEDMYKWKRLKKEIGGLCRNMK